jgi:hypothetical protein
MAPDKVVGSTAEVRLVELSEQIRLLMIVVTVVSFAVLVTGLVILKLLLSTSTEPPIHVKHGSLVAELEVANGLNSWKKAGNKWKIDKGAKSDNTYDVEIHLRSGEASSLCKGGTDFKGVTKVRVTYSDEVWIELESTSQKTFLTPSFALTQPNDRRLEHHPSASGYIRDVKINDNPDPVCTFDNDTELDYVGLY